MVFDKSKFQFLLIPFLSMVLSTIPLLSMVLILPLFTSQPLFKYNLLKKDEQRKNTEKSSKTKTFYYPIHQPHYQNNLNPHGIYQWESFSNQKSSKKNSE